jgi:hypothetical protein
MAIQQATYNKSRLEIGEALKEFLVDRENYYVGSRILPMLAVPKAEANFPKIMREGLLRRADVKRAVGGAYNRDAFDVEDDSYQCFEYGVEIKLDDSEIALYANDFDAEAAKAEVAINKLLNEYEIRVAAAVFNTTTWTGSTLYTDTTVAWTTSTSATPVSDVQDAKEKVRALTGMIPDTVVLNQTAFVGLLKADDIKDRIKYVEVLSQANLANALAGVFGVRQVLVAPAVYNSAGEGPAFSAANVWSSDYAMVCVAAKPGDRLVTPCIGRTFSWSPDAGFPYTMETYREEQTRSEVLRVRHYVDEKIFDASYGHLLKIG